MVHRLGARHDDRLEGLTLTTGRTGKPATFSARSHITSADGLIPNMFPEGHDEGLYHTADATLWFFHAMARYVEIARDQLFLSQILPQLEEIIEYHLRGTDFGIGVDPNDGLLAQGAPGYQLTWMDAKVDDWVVTPRRGKAVEINALWYNALCYMTALVGRGSAAEKAARDGDSTRDVAATHSRTFLVRRRRVSVRCGRRRGLATTRRCRPNQIFAISLDVPGSGRKTSGPR